MSADGAGAEQAGSTALGSDTSASTDAAAASEAAPAASSDAGSRPSAADTAAQSAQAPASSGETVATPAADDAESRTDAVGDGTQSTSGVSGEVIDDAAAVDETAERVVPACPKTYTAGAGDSWYRIADAAGVSPSAVMSENRATGDTVILPGDEVCLPAEATIPAQPTAATATTAPETTDAPPSTTAPSTTDAPSTTSAPVATASAEAVKELIRQTWPTDQHETAFTIARRESKLNPRADNNSCCYGVFQIYFEVHKGWLDDFGVYTASDLFDAEKNIAAAHHLYERAGGWGPWGF